MQIKTVFYSALANLGNYQNERVGMKAELEEGDSPEAVIEELRQRVTPLCHKNLQELQNRRYELENQLYTLEDKLKKAQQQWEVASSFLKAQGIQENPVGFPVLDNLLPQAQEEVVVGEYEPDYEDDEEESEYDQ